MILHLVDMKLQHPHNCFMQGREEFEAIENRASLNGWVGEARGTGEIFAEKKFGNTES